MSARELCSKRRGGMDKPFLLRPRYQVHGIQEWMKFANFSILANYITVKENLTNYYIWQCK